MADSAEYNEFIEEDIPPDRPVFLVILSFLHLGGGIFVVWMLFRYWNAFEKIDLSGIATRPQLVFSLAVIGGVSIVGAIGAFIRKRWGWWLFAFYYVHAILRYCNALLVCWQMRDEPEISEDMMQRHVIKFTGRIIISLLLLRYLFARKVIAYFGWQQVNWKKRLGTLVSVAVVVGAIGYLI